MKRETWKCWTWCALVFGTTVLFMNLLMLIPKKEEGQLLTLDKVDKLCAEKGWFYVSSTLHKTNQQSFYLSKENKKTEQLIALPMSCKDVHKWNGVILVQNYTHSPNTIVLSPDGDCSNNHFGTHGSIYLFGDAEMVRDMLHYLNYP